MTFSYRYMVPSILFISLSIFYEQNFLEVELEACCFHLKKHLQFYKARNFLDKNTRQMQDS